MYQVKDYRGAAQLPLEAWSTGAKKSLINDVYAKARELARLDVHSEVFRPRSVRRIVECSGVNYNCRTSLEDIIPSIWDMNPDQTIEKLAMPFFKSRPDLALRRGPDMEDKDIRITMVSPIGDHYPIRFLGQPSLAQIVNCVREQHRVDIVFPKFFKQGKLAVADEDGHYPFDQGDFIAYKPAQIVKKKGGSWCASSWNITSLRDFRSEVGVQKLAHIQKLAAKGLVCLQETKWRPGDAGEVARKIPHVIIASTPAVYTEHGGYSGGVATVIPTHLGYTFQEELHIVPGRVLLVKAKWNGVPIRIWNAYLPPTTRQPTMDSWLRWIRENDHDECFEQVDIVLGDLNCDSSKETDKSLQQEVDKMFALLKVREIKAKATDGPTATFVTSRGTASTIDRGAISQTEADNEALKWTLQVIPSATNIHAVIQLRADHRKKRKLDKQVIPGYVFNPYSEDTKELRRRMVRNAVEGGLSWKAVMNKEDSEECCMHDPWGTLDNMKVTLHDWWNRMDKDKKGSLLSWRTTFTKAVDQASHARANHVSIPRVIRDKVLDYLGLEDGDHHDSVSEIVSLPTELAVTLRDLVHNETASWSLMQQGFGGLPSKCGTQSKPKIFERFRKVVPKAVPHDGELWNGKEFTDDPSQLEAMFRESREALWTTPAPTSTVKQLEEIKWYMDDITRREGIPDFSTLPVDDIFKIIMRTNDSAPGGDRVPYAAWRLVGWTISLIINQILRQAERDPESFYAQIDKMIQTVVFIPKKETPVKAADMRPLALPDTIVRILSSCLLAILARALKGKLAQEQAMFARVKETHVNYDRVQAFLDGGDDSTGSPRMACFADISKAFERIDPHWIVMVAMAWGAPPWVVWLITVLTTGRISQFSTGGKKGGCLDMLAGIDMGAGASPFLFALAMDPLLRRIQGLDGVRLTSAYVDDIAVGVEGIEPVASVAVLLQDQKTITGLDTTSHSCYNVTLMIRRDAGYASLVVHGRSYRHAASEALEVWGPQGAVLAFVRGVRYDHRRLLQVREEGYRRLDTLVPMRCGCDCKVVVVPSRPLDEEEWRCLDEQPWGAAVVNDEAGYLGMTVTSPYDWRLRDGLRARAKMAITRKERAYVKPLLKMWARVRAFARVRLSLVARVVTWNVYIITLFSYVAMRIAPPRSVVQEVWKAMAAHMRTKHWIARETLAGLTHALGIRPVPVTIEAVAAASIVSATTRIKGSGWLEDISQDGQFAGAQRALLDAAEKVKGNDWAMTKYNVIMQEAHLLPTGKLSQKLGRWVRDAWGEYLAMKAQAKLRERARIRRYWSTDATEFEELARCDGQGLAKFNVLKLFLGGLVDYRKARHFGGPVTEVVCSVCGTVDPCDGYAMPWGHENHALCRTHWNQVCIDVQAGYRFAIPSVLAHWDVWTDQKLPSDVREVGERVLAAAGHRADLVTMLAQYKETCTLCGAGPDDIEHIMCYCPVTHLACSLVSGWREGGMYKVDSGFQVSLLNEIYYMVVARRVDASRGGESYDHDWLADARELNARAWIALGEPKPRHIAELLVSRGCKLTARYRDRGGVNRSRSILADWGIARVANLSKYHLSVCVAVRRGRGKACHLCSPMTCRPAIISMRPKERAENPFPIQARARPRLCTTGDHVRGAQLAWASYGERERVPSSFPVLYWNAEKFVAPRRSRPGDAFNAFARVHRCKCGGWLIKLVAARPIFKGEEVVTATPGLGALKSRPRLVMTADGGAKYPRGDPAVGAGVVGWIYRDCTPIKVLEIAYPLFDDSTAQQAEAYALWAAEGARGDALKAASDIGIVPDAPDLLLVDSGLTASVTNGLARARSANILGHFRARPEADAFGTRSWSCAHIPRTMNGAADRMATLACQLVLLARAAGWDRADPLVVKHGLEVASPLYVKKGDDVGLISGLIPKESLAAGRGWTSADPTAYQWGWEQPTWNDKALYIAVVSMASKGNMNGVKYLAAWMEAARSARSLGVPKGQWGVPVFYTTRESCGGGRLYARSLGAQRLPKGLRAACFQGHSEYDISGCHVAIFASRVESAGRHAEGVYRDLQLRRDDLIGLGMTKDDAKQTLTAILHDGGSESAHWHFGSWAAAPDWLLDYTREVAMARGGVLRRLRTQGFGAVEEFNLKNELYFALEGVEAAIIAEVLRRIRFDFGLSSHAIVHDALILDSALPEDVISAHFREASVMYGVPFLRVRRKELGVDNPDAKSALPDDGRLLEGHWLPSQYSGLAALLSSQDREDNPSKRRKGDGGHQVSMLRYVKRSDDPEQAAP